MGDQIDPLKGQIGQVTIRGRKTTETSAFAHTQTARTRTGLGIVKRALIVVSVRRAEIGRSTSAAPAKRTVAKDKREPPMSSLNEAFEFLFEFDDGNVELGMPIAPEHAENIKLLAMDLLTRYVDVSGLSMPEVYALLSEMASVNTRWNHSLQQCLDRAYRLAGQGSLGDATKLLDSFVSDCPSRFYTEIATGVKEEILGGESK